MKPHYRQALKIIRKPSFKIFFPLLSFLLLFTLSAQGISTMSSIHKDAIVLKSNTFITASSYPDPVEEKLVAMGLRKTGITNSCLASWYGEQFEGRTTANNEIFDKELMTAAHKTLRLNTFLLVTNLDNGRKVIVRVNDRGPYVEGRDLDLSMGAAGKLNAVSQGVIRIKYEILS